MLVKCKTKNNEPIQIYDLDYLKDLDLKDFGLSDIKEITELDGNLPIYPLNDIILSQITKRSTISQKLINLGLLTWLDILLEFHEIEAKESNLSK